MLWIPYFAMSKRKRLLDQVNKQSQRDLETNYINVKWEMPLKRTYFPKWHVSWFSCIVDSYIKKHSAFFWAVLELVFID